MNKNTLGMGFKQILWTLIRGALNIFYFKMK